MSQIPKPKKEKMLKYSKPELVIYGKVTQVTQKSGGAEDGQAAMMDKSGGG